MQTSSTLNNRYSVLRRLGGGTFGTTYLAEDKHLPGKPKCVVKQLNPDVASLPVARVLFEREANSLYTLGNKYNQIPTLKAHFEENGKFYLVQEFVDGDDLTKELTPGKQFSEQEVVKLLKEILEVLKGVHQDGCIHRDIKPANIMRRRLDKKIILIDFGAVKEINSLKANVKAQGSLTPTIVIGTPGYMPIEQLNAQPQFSSDIYAVGILGIQAITGKLPTEFQKHDTGEVTWKPHTHKISNFFAAFLNKMVCTQHYDRFQNATEALKALEQVERTNTAIGECNKILSTQINPPLSNSPSSNHQTLPPRSSSKQDPMDAYFLEVGKLLHQGVGYALFAILVLNAFSSRDLLWQRTNHLWNQAPWNKKAEPPKPSPTPFISRPSPEPTSSVQPVNCRLNPDHWVCRWLKSPSPTPKP